MGYSFSQEDYILRAIGKISVSFTRLEVVISESIREFITNDYELYQCITSGMAFNELLKLLSSLVNYRISDENVKKEFRDLIIKIDGMRVKRNDFTHSEWFLPSGRSESAFRKKSSRTIKKGLAVDVFVHKLPELLEFDSQIWEGIRELNTIMEKIRPIIIQHRKKTINRNAQKISSELSRTKK